MTTTDPVESAWLALVQSTVLLNIVLPGAVLVASMVFRLVLGRPFTTASDAILAVLAFDAAVIASAQQFQELFTSPKLAAYSIQIHLLLFVIGGIAWGLVVAAMEPRLAFLQNGGPNYGFRSWALSGTGIVIAGVVIALHAVTYTSGT